MQVSFLRMQVFEDGNPITLHAGVFPAHAGV